MSAEIGIVHLQQILFEGGGMRTTSLSPEETLLDLQGLEVRLSGKPIPEGAVRILGRVEILEDDELLLHCHGPVEDPEGLPHQALTLLSLEAVNTTPEGGEGVYNQSALEPDGYSYLFLPKRGAAVLLINPGFWGEIAPAFLEIGGSQFEIKVDPNEGVSLERSH